MCSAAVTGWPSRRSASTGSVPAPAERRTAGGGVVREAASILLQWWQAEMREDAAPGKARARALSLALQCGGSDGYSGIRSEEHTSELQSLMRISYAVFCLKKKKTKRQTKTKHTHTTKTQTIYTTKHAIRQQ